MKKYLVIGNPIDHSLSPKLHNFWFKKHNISANYGKKKTTLEDLEILLEKIRNKEINGINVTVPFKKQIIAHLDSLSLESEKTQSVNTIYLSNDKIIGHNTDIGGFENSIKSINYDLSQKTVFIIGSGGVVPSIIYALEKMKVSRIMITNRTKNKAESLRDLFKDLSIVNWGEVPETDMVINATSVGLQKEDKLNLDFSKIKNGKLFYDIIYNPKETLFLKEAKKLGNKTENGKKMFIYQAAEAFNIWHKIQPKIDKETTNLIEE